MKTLKNLFGLSFGILLISTFLLQSVHSYEHLHKVWNEKQCHHVYAKNKTIVGHKHAEFDHCFSCEFTFSPNTTPEVVNFVLYNPQFCVQKAVVVQAQIHPLFKDGLFLLRAPPIVIA